MAEQTLRTETADDVIAAVDEHDVRFIRLWFTDVLGQLKSFSINSSELEDAFEGGMGFDGSSITGFNPIEESDMIAMPDPSSFAILPWRPDENATGADVLRHPGARRRALRGRSALDPAPGARARLASSGFDGYNIGPELEYFYFKDARPAGGAPEILDEGGYFDLTTLDAGSDVRRETILALEQLGIHVEYAHHEVGPSQHEVDMRYKDALAMSDDCMTYRIVVKEYAMKYGWHATFMPKPLFGENGSGMHVHQSLSKDGRNAFYDADDQYFLSRDGEVVHRRPAPPRARDRAAVRAVGQLLQAAGPGLRGARLPGLVAAQPLGADPGAALSPRQGAGDPRRAALPRPGLQPLPLLRRDAARRPRGDREGLRAARADGAEPLPPDARGARAAGDRAAAREPRRGDRDRRRVRARAAGRSASTRSSASSRSSARSGRSTASRSRPGRSSASSRSSERL